MEFENIAAFKSNKGKELQASPWMIITQEMVDQFATSTMDNQWIHIDTERARRESPFGGPIAHGFLTLSLISHLMSQSVKVKSAKMGVNYGLNKVRFVSPVPVGSKIRMVPTLTDYQLQGDNGLKSFWNCVVEIEGQEKPACVAEWITLMFE